MPLARFPTDVARQNLRYRPSLWPDDRVKNDRLQGVAKLAVRSSFSFSPSDRIMTVGSCFAREMEKRLHTLGFDLPMLALALSPDERASATLNDHINKYTVHSMVNEFLWAFEEAPEPAPDDLFFRLDSGLWHDPQLIASLEPTTLEKATDRRGAVRSAFRGLPSCRVLILTLGLAEAWFDHDVGVYLNGPPPTEIQRRQPQRFTLDLLSYDEIVAGLEAIHGVLQRHGHPDGKLLVTVSPVPFRATFTGVDAIQANAYSKSVQRAAAEAFARSRPNVDYFPSYEIVQSTQRELAYESDNIHVSKMVVHHIMDTVLAAYCPMLQVGDPLAVDVPVSRRRQRLAVAELIRAAKHHAADRDYERAAQTYEELFGLYSKRIEPADVARLRRNFGNALLRVDDPEAAATQYGLAVAADPNDDRAYFQLGIAFGRLKRMEESVSALRQAASLNPAADTYARLALGLQLMQRRTEAIEAYEQALRLEPGKDSVLTALARLTAEAEPRNPAITSAAERTSAPPG